MSKRKIYHCNYCDYETDRKSNYNKHIISNKHIKNKAAYATKHSVNNLNEVEELRKQVKEKDEVIATLTKTNADLTKIIKAGNISAGTISKASIPDKEFLDTYCKDAVSLDDFINNIKFKLTDFAYPNSLLPIKEPVWNVLKQQLLDLQITGRPIYCANKKLCVFWVNDKHQGWVKKEKNEVVEKVLVVYRNALMGAYDTFDEMYPPPHSGRTLDKKDKIVNPIRNGLKKSPQRIVPKLAALTNIKNVKQSL